MLHKPETTPPRFPTTSATAPGQAFTTGHGLWRCTDVGTRTAIAIRIDAAEVVSVMGGRETQSIVDPRRDRSWLNGPSYALAETVFDEYDFAVLRPVAERDVMGWKPERPQG